MKQKEAFIPCSRRELINLCLEEGKLDNSASIKFRDFCTILAAYYHFKFHQPLEGLKCSYAPFDPDTHVKSNMPSGDRPRMELQLVAGVQHLLEQSNYVAISKPSLKKALQEKSLLDLDTEVDLNDFQQVICYSRGEIEQVTSRKKFFFWKEQQTIELFARVALLIKFKNTADLAKRKVNGDKNKLEPNKIYLYLYKNLPKFDLEFIFPNVKIKMTKKDLILFSVPALGAAISIGWKIIPRLSLIASVLLYIMGLDTNIDALEVEEEDVKNLMPLLLAILSLILTLGGFAFQQFSSYQSKQFAFQKDVTENLFYRRIATNSGVFKSLTDDAEEEVCKQIILVYYHLLTSSVPLQPAELDQQIETWMEEKFGSTLDFDIDETLGSLEEIRGKVRNDELPLMSYDSEGNCQVLSLDDAKIVIDYVWDNFFSYS